MPDEGGAKTVVRVVTNGQQPVVQHQGAPPGRLATTQCSHKLVKLPIVQAAACDLQHEGRCLSPASSMKC